MNPTLHGVMAYEDLSVAKLAKQRWDDLVNALRNGFRFELRVWKFDALRIPELRDAAMIDAAKAQMVIVVTHGIGELPLPVKAWIEQWLALKERNPDAASLLAFLFDHSSEQFEASAFSQFAYLQQTARKGSMDFITSATPGQDSPSVIRLHRPASVERSGESLFGPGRIRQQLIAEL